MRRELIGNQVFRAASAVVCAVLDDVMCVLMCHRQRSRGWWDDVQALDRRPLISGLVASGAVRG